MKLSKYYNYGSLYDIELLTLTKTKVLMMYEVNQKHYDNQLRLPRPGLANMSYYHAKGYGGVYVK